MGILLPLCTAFVAIFVASDSTAETITFETKPDGTTPLDNEKLGLDDGYAVGGATVTFGQDTDDDGIPDLEAKFERIGPDTQRGFTGCDGGNEAEDTADAGFEAQLGDFFLRGPRAGGNMLFRRLIIDYSGTLPSAASGEIWDIDGGSDGTERYRIQALDSGGGVLATIDSPVGEMIDGCADDPLDGRPWVFSFDGLAGGIARITIDFIGTRTGGFGLAFNNFNATEPAVSVEAESWGAIKQHYR